MAVKSFRSRKFSVLLLWVNVANVIDAYLRAVGKFENRGSGDK